MKRIFIVFGVGALALFVGVRVFDAIREARRPMFYTVSHDGGYMPYPPESDDDGNVLFCDWQRDLVVIVQTEPGMTDKLLFSKYRHTATSWEAVLLRGSEYEVKIARQDFVLILVGRDGQRMTQPILRGTAGDLLGALGNYGDDHDLIWRVCDFFERRGEPLLDGICANAREDPESN